MVKTSKNVAPAHSAGRFAPGSLAVPALSKLLEEVQVNLAHRWFLRYDLDEPVSDHSVQGESALWDEALRPRSEGRASRAPR
jgi:hypothetical protein